MDSAPVTVETLLAHRDWVRAVACSVVRDAEAAADVEQETWLAAMRSPPRSATSLRGWLGAVVRSRARRIGRDESSRERRENAAARDEGTMSAAELAEIADTHRRVVQAVVELAEPYRQTILLRYFEGLAVEDVAARTAVPLDTARSRISRGLAKLRERLSRELGTDERPWRLALAPLVGAWTAPRTGTTTGAALGGGVLMGSKTVAAFVAAGVLVAVVGWRVVESRSAPVPTDVVAVETADSPPRPTAPTPRPRAKPVELERSVEVAARAEVVAQEPKERTVEERLNDLVEPIEFDGDDPMTALGRLAEAVRVPIVVSAEAAEAMAKLDGGIHAAFADTMTGHRLLGRMTKVFVPEFVVEKDRVVIVPSDGKSDATRPVVVPPRPAAAERITVLGRVVDADGVAVVGAEVSRVGNDKPKAVTDVAGRYELKLARPFGEVEARADWRVASPAVVVTGATNSQVTIDLVLGGRAGTVRVRVVSEEGPLYGVFVTLGAEDGDEAKPSDGIDGAQRPRVDATGEDGLAVFPGVAVGEVHVSVERRGYDSATRTAVVEAGRVAEVEVKLARKATLKERFEKARVTARFHHAKLDEALAVLRRASDIQVFVSPEVAAMGSTRTVSLAWEDAPLPAAFRELCREAGGLEYELIDDMDCVVLRVAQKK